MRCESRVTVSIFLTHTHTSRPSLISSCFLPPRIEIVWPLLPWRSLQLHDSAMVGALPAYYLYSIVYHVCQTGTVRSQDLMSLSQVSTCAEDCCQQAWQILLESQSRNVHMGIECRYLLWCFILTSPSNRQSAAESTAARASHDGRVKSFS